MRGANLSGADFQCATIRNSDFSALNPGANSTRTNLSGADLESAQIENTNFTQADFRNANLAGTFFSSGNFTNALFGGASFRCAYVFWSACTNLDTVVTASQCAPNAGQPYVPTQCPGTCSNLVHCPVTGE